MLHKIILFALFLTLPTKGMSQAICCGYVESHDQPRGCHFAEDTWGRIAKLVTALRDSTPLDPEDLMSTMSEFYQNKHLNDLTYECLAFLKKTPNHDVSEVAIIDTLFDFSFKTLPQNLKVLQKVENLKRKWEQQARILKREKMNMSELRSFISISRFSEVFENLRNWFGLERGYEKWLQDLESSIFLARDFHDMALQECQETSPQGLKWVAYDLKKDFLYRQTNRPVVALMHATGKVIGFRFAHLSTAFKGSNQQEMEAHMWGQPSVYNIGAKPLASYAYQTFVLDMDKLLPVKNRRTSIERFQKLYGENWKIILSEKLELVAQRYFENEEKFEELYNSRTRRIRMIMGAAVRMHRYAVKEHSQFSTSGKVTCSEFVIKSFAQCIDLLNLEIQKNWAELIGDGRYPQLDLDIQTWTPVNLLTPQKATKLMIKKGYLKLIQPPAIIRKILKL